MIKVLFVCLGNICRSPIAQGVFEDLVKKKGLQEHFYVDSAGVSGYHRGEPPHELSCMIAEKYSINITMQRSRPVTPGDKFEFDYFIAMDQSNHSSLIKEFGVDPEKLYCLREFDKISGEMDVPDPYGLNLASFDEVYKIISSSVEQFLNHLLKKINL